MELAWRYWLRVVVSGLTTFFVVVLGAVSGAGFDPMVVAPICAVLVAGGTAWRARAGEMAAPT